MGEQQMVIDIGPNLLSFLLQLVSVVAAGFAGYHAYKGRQEANASAVNRSQSSSTGVGASSSASSGHDTRPSSTASK